jgi:hypothetical protein
MAPAAKTNFIIFSILGLFTMLQPSTGSSQVDIIAHLGGLISGILLALMLMDVPDNAPCKRMFTFRYYFLAFYILMFSAVVTTIFLIPNIPVNNFPEHCPL